METEFDFELWERILNKLKEGGQLTPEEQKAYDGLFDSANEGLDITGQPDFKKLLDSYYGDVSGNINREFESAYGQNVVSNPDGTISFSRPGSVIENFMRRGLSVSDGPVMGALSEGLTNRDLALTKARESALTNAYRDMTAIRQQNLDAKFRAGQLAQGAASRRVASLGAGRRVGGGGGGEGPGGEPMRLPLPDQPDLWERILPGMLAALGTGGLAMARDAMNRNSPRAGGRMEAFKPYDDVPLPPTRPQPSNDQYDKIEAQRATQTALDPLTTKGTSLGDENYQAEQLLGPGMSPGSFENVNAAAPVFDSSANFTPPAQLPGLGANFMTGAPQFNPYGEGTNWNQYLGQQQEYVSYPQYQQPQEYPQWNPYQDMPTDGGGYDFYDEYQGGDDSWYGGGDGGGGEYVNYEDWGYM